MLHQFNQSERLALHRYSDQRNDGTVSYNDMAFMARQTAFVGREHELQALEQFMAGESPLCWWQVAGQAGQGKSRFALQFLDHYCQGNGLYKDWDCGFLSQDDLRTTTWNKVKFNKPTLVIIDYVAPHPRP